MLGVRRIVGAAIFAAGVMGLLVLASTSVRTAAEARLVRYPDYRAGRVAFTYLGFPAIAPGIWMSISSPWTVARPRR
jgi:hypothetical protein